MILHVTFTDGSNPYVTLPTDREGVEKMWRAWVHKCPDTARPVAYSGKSHCFPNPYKQDSYYVRIVRPTSCELREYKRLGYALRELERRTRL